MQKKGPQGTARYIAQLSCSPTARSPGGASPSLANAQTTPLRSDAARLARVLQAEASPAAATTPSALAADRSPVPTTTPRRDSIGQLPPASHATSFNDWLLRTRDPGTPLATPPTLTMLLCLPMLLG